MTGPGDRPGYRRRLPPWSTLRGRLALGAIAGLVAAAVVFAVVSSSLVRSETSRAGRADFDRLAQRMGLLLSSRVERAVFKGQCDTFRTQDLEAFLGTGARLAVKGLSFCPGAVVPYGSLPEAVRAPLDERIIARQGYQRLDYRLPGDTTATVATAAPITINGLPIAWVVVTKPVSEVSTRWEDVVPSLLMAAAVGFVPALLLTLLLTARVTRPLEAMEHAAGQVAAGDLSVTVPRAGTAELDHLGSAFNEMVTRLREREDGSREFLMKITHDLRTPLTAIRGHAAALADGVVPEQHVPRSLAAIESEAGRLESMVADLLDLARIDARRFRLEHSAVDPREVLVQAFDAFTADAARRGVRYDRRLGTLPRISTDPARLRQIVGNLLDNALRWVPDGGSVTMEATPTADRGVMVRVDDDGPGVPADQREEVFQPFRSGETPDGRVGTGLGLAICRQLARQLGGEVGVEESPLGGARFTLTLPPMPPGGRPAPRSSPEVQVGT